MTTSLDRKIERATREAEEDRKRRSPALTPEAFAKDNHLPDSTVRPSSTPTTAPGVSEDACMKPKPQYTMEDFKAQVRILVSDEVRAVAASPELQAKLNMGQLRHMGRMYPQHDKFWGSLPDGSSMIHRPKR